MNDALPIIGGLVTALVAALSLMTKMWLSQRKARKGGGDYDVPSTIEKIDLIFGAMQPVGVADDGRSVRYDFRSNVQLLASIDDLAESNREFAQSNRDLAEAVDRQAAATTKLAGWIEKDRQTITKLFQPMADKIEELAEIYGRLPQNGI